MQTEPPRDLQDLQDAVCGEETFLRFVAALAEDWDDEQAKERANPSPPHGPGANGWENGTIGALLERAAAWGSATKEGTVPYTPPTNVWRRCAQILWSGKFHE